MMILLISVKSGTWIANLLSWKLYVHRTNFLRFKMEDMF